MMNRLIAIITICFFSTVNFAQALEEHWWQTNGDVKAIVTDSTTGIVYLGGDFDFVGINESFGTQISANTAEPNYEFSNPNGSVLTSISDGNGGWFIGGSFTIVGDSIRNHIAHLNQYGQVTSWNPDVNGDVNSICIWGNNVIIGGDFTTVGPLMRPHFAVINSSSGSVLPWNLGADGTIFVMKIDGNYLFVGGSFTNIGGQSRYGLAQVNLATEQVTAWDPNPNSNTSTIAVSNTTVFVGGGFTTIGGQSRNHIAALDIVTGLATPWNANANGFFIDVIQIDNNIIYAGGAFSTIGGQTRNNIAALNIVTGLATTWNPNVINTSATCYVSGIGIIGQSVYIGGRFEAVDSQPRINLAAIDISTGNVNSWKSNISDYVRTISIYDTNLYVGGDYTSVKGEQRNNLAALDLSTGSLNSWNPNANSIVNCLLVSGDTIFVGGGFTTIGGMNHPCLVGINSVDGNPYSWNPNILEEVTSLSLNSNKLYVIGSFTSIGGLGRNKIAAFDTQTGLLTNWDPNSNAFGISSIVAQGNYVYVGGNFTMIGGETRNNIAKIDATTGLATSWNPGCNGSINTMILRGSTLFVGGGFFFMIGQPSIGGEQRNRLAALDITTGLVNDWNPNPNSDIRALAYSNNRIYAVGSFTTIGGLERSKGAELDPITANVGNWNAHSDNMIFAVSVRDSIILIGGNFTMVKGNYRYNFAAYNQNIVPALLTVNLFSQPSDANSCVGNLTISATGTPDFTETIDGGSPFTHSGYTLVNDLCPGVHSLFTTDGFGDTLTQPFVIPVDSNYIFNNPFIDSIAVDSLGATIEDCEIYYNGIDTAYIDSIFANGNTVTVIWNIVDSNGSNFDTSSYVLNNGNGVYYLQLSVFCPTKALGDYFTVTEAIYFEDGNISTAGLAVLDDDLFQLFPNPTNDLITIRFEAPKAELVIYDAQGKLVQTQTIQSGEGISLGKLETGIYFFELTTGTGRIVKRVVKQLN